MKFDEAMESLEQHGFRWERFREYFPFGDIGLREGNYQRLLGRALLLVSNPERMQLLLDLLDAQACVFVEQTWVQNEQLQAEGLPQAFTIEPHFATAWLQINDNLRFEHGLPIRGARPAMLSLKPPETLASRIVIHDRLHRET